MSAIKAITFVVYRRMMSVFNNLNDDVYKPAIIKPELNQYENYGIYNISCTDIVYDVLDKKKKAIGEVTSQYNNWLAVQFCGIDKPKIDFTQIMQEHP
jgi:hypothetical protein